MPGTAKVGALVILFLALLAGGYTLLGRFLPWSKTKTLYARFDDATGVALGTKVLMAGVPVGSVTETRLQPDGRSALLTLRLDEGARVPRGTRATIPASFIGFGDVAIHLLPPAETTALEESPGATLVGFRPGTLDSMLPSDNPTVRELTATMRATRELLGDQGLRTDLRKLLQSTNDTLVRFGGLATETQSLLARNRGQLDLALRNTARAMEDVEQSASMVAKLMKEGKLQAKSLALLDQLGATAGKAQTLVGDLDRFVTDPKLREPLAQTMGHVAQITDTGTKIATNTETLTKNGAVITAKAIELADKANAIADEAHELLKKLGGVLSKPGAKAPPIHAEMRLMRESHPNRWRTDIDVETPILDSTVRLGLFDAFESNKISAQLAKPFSRAGDYRYGIYASKPGVGVDYRLAPRLGLRSDLFDINNPTFNLAAQYEFRDGVVGWFGMDRILRRNAATVGIGLSR